VDFAREVLGAKAFLIPEKSRLASRALLPQNAQKN